MFFKKRVPVTEYYDTCLKLMFSDEQTQRWIDFLNDSEDAVLMASNQHRFIDEIRGAHLQLLSLAVVKKYHDVFMMSLGCSRETQFLKETGNERLESVKNAYNAAFGRSSEDGIAEMVKLLNLRLCNGNLSHATVELFISMMYRSVGLMFRDFKKIKLTTP